MKTTILNYSIVIDPDTETGSNKPGFTAYCPGLGIADDGDTVEEALLNIQKTIEFHLQCLAQEGEEIPSPSSPRSFLTHIQVQAPVDAHVFAS
jgi:predicted RNase H-like HicB family nuclease